MGWFNTLALTLLLGVVGASTDDGLINVFSANMTVSDKTYYCVKIPTIITLPSGDLMALGEGLNGLCGPLPFHSTLL